MIRFCKPLFRSCPGGHGREDGVGEHGQGDVPVPARMPADFALVQAALVLRAPETGLDRPAAAGHVTSWSTVVPVGA